MKFKIHFEYENGMEDILCLSGGTIEEIRIELKEEMSRRNAKYLWSEKIEEEGE